MLGTARRERSIGEKMSFIPIKQSVRLVRTDHQLLLPTVVTAFLVLAQPVCAQSFETPPPSERKSTYHLTGEERFKWALNSSFGPLSVFTISTEAAMRTWSNSPEEYGTHWDGYGKRVASRFGSAAVSNSLEASLGSLWGEDPRYHRRGEGSGKSRLGYAVKMAFFAQNETGGVRPAYARMIALPSGRFISNAWREPSEMTAGNTSVGIGLAFVKKIGGNTFREFWPDLRRKFSRSKTSPDND